MTGLHAWVYPWDLADHGTAAVAGWLADAAVDVVHVAASYHSLFATVPDNPIRHHVDLPTSAVFVEPHEARWAGAGVRPALSPMVAEVGDALTLARPVAERAGCAVSAWTVCLHDSELGRRRPDLAVENVWGERVLTAPCLRHPDVRDLARRLVEDVGSRADRVQLESPTWSSLPHHRHAKLPAAAADLVARLTELCWCHRCRQATSALDVDVDALQAQVRRLWEEAHRSADRTWQESLHRVPGLREHAAARRDAVTALVGQLVAAADVPVEVVAFGDRERAGLQLADVEAVGAQVRVLAYGSAKTVAASVAALDRSPDRPRSWSAGISLLPEHAADADDLVGAATTAAAAGAVSVSIYHLGLGDAVRRRWLPAVAAAIRPAATAPDLVGGPR
jgi:hypothetical protein